MAEPIRRRPRATLTGTRPTAAPLPTLEPADALRPAGRPDLRLSPFTPPPPSGSASVDAAAPAGPLLCAVCMLADATRALPAAYVLLTPQHGMIGRCAAHLPRSPEQRAEFIPVDPNERAAAQADAEALTAELRREMVAMVQAATEEMSGRMAAEMRAVSEHLAARPAATPADRLRQWVTDLQAMLAAQAEMQGELARARDTIACLQREQHERRRIIDTQEDELRRAHLAIERRDLRVADMGRFAQEQELVLHRLAGELTAAEARIAALLAEQVTPSTTPAAPADAAPAAVIGDAPHAEVAPPAATPSATSGVDDASRANESVVAGEPVPVPATRRVRRGLPPATPPAPEAFAKAVSAIAAQTTRKPRKRAVASKTCAKATDQGAGSLEALCVPASGAPACGPIQVGRDALKSWEKLTPTERRTCARAVTALVTGQGKATLAAIGPANAEHRSLRAGARRIIFEPHTERGYTLVDIVSRGDRRYFTCE